MGAGFASVFGVADGANALAGLPVVLARHNARESGEFVGKRSGIFSEGGLHPCRLRLRQRQHQSDRKRAHSVLSQNLLHVELLYVAKRLYCSFLLTGQYAAKNQCLQEK
jgi:hypothetical protein